MRKPASRYPAVLMVVEQVTKVIAQSEDAAQVTEAAEALETAIGFAADPHLRDSITFYACCVGAYARFLQCRELASHLRPHGFNQTGCVQLAHIECLRASAQALEAAGAPMERRPGWTR